ncbi:prephenate dehydratase [Thiomicrospira sp. WB1]|uniref:prephenate dehydratase n=1 Tax=Thiomicrospira sp. WB1 TaxID=1685380 RepID=UPI0007471186|nr:prephenate dehydratase [Thiomicrospira sp. WB1]KUJ72045.1 prephenate dehydratase [Thiomicrospira sp. WB1]
MSNATPSASEQAELGVIREEIDAIDAQIQSLIAQRAECAQKVADIKTRGGQVEAVFYRPEREAQVLRAVKERNHSLIPDEDMARLFREIMSLCLALEQPIKVAYLGPEGSYSHACVIKQFGTSVHPHAVGSIQEVFQAVEKKHVQYGVVPVENSSEGVVKQTQKSLMDTSLTITGEVDLAIHHCLLAQTPDPHQLKKIVAHPQALGQCENWLSQNLPGLVIEEVASNAVAAQMAEADPKIGAIASEQAARLYGLKILETHIEDQKSNTTKFWVLGHEAAGPSGVDKTAMILSVPNQAGSLIRVLDGFAKRGISMTRIISVPSTETRWDYIFYIDILGHQQQPDVHEALTEVQAQCSYFKLLGSYPVSPLD